MDFNSDFVVKATLEADLHRLLNKPDGGVKIIRTPLGGGKAKLFRPSKNGVNFVIWFTKKTVILNYIMC
jgi:hypothetical protein